MTKHYFIPAKMTLAVALLTALAMLSSCSKKEPATDHSEMTMPETHDTAQASAPAAEPAAMKTAMATPKRAELSPLPPEMTQLMASNRTASVYDQIHYLKESPFSDTEKAQAFMTLLPSFDRDGQRAMAHAAVDYLQDSTHSLILTPLIEGKLDKQILSVFMTDTLKRPDAIKIPALRTLASIEGHPMQTEAEELLQAFGRTATASNNSLPQAAVKTD